MLSNIYDGAFLQKRLSATNYFRKKDPSQIFDRVLNTPQRFVHSQILLFFTRLRPRLLPYRNQSTVSPFKSSDWFLYEGNICLKWVDLPDI